MISTESKSKRVLDSFTHYCDDHPDQRFWQALRNWSGYSFIYVVKGMFSSEGLTDTFYFEGRRGTLHSLTGSDNER